MERQSGPPHNRAGSGGQQGDKRMAGGTGRAAEGVFTGRSRWRRAMAALPVGAALLAGTASPAAGAQPVAADPASAAPGWTVAAARGLRAAIAAAADDGLDPRDYAPEALDAALRAGDAVLIARAATASYRRLARDLIEGHVTAAARRDWHVAGPAADGAAIDRMMAAALAGGRIGPELAALAPRHPQYRALRAALAATPPGEAARIEALRVNMERWRWLPRELGARHLLVNVPGYTLDLVEGGRVTARHRVIVGRAQTPTPQFGAEVAGVILNPWWDVPASIVAESVGALIRRNPATARARGYVWQADAAGHLRVRQMPGPGNSLGLMKLVMPNPFSIFVHDTPAKALFARPVRAFSHGCIRTENPLDLAALLTGGSRAQIDAQVAGGDTLRLPVTPLPVYIVYLTAIADDNGRISQLPDIYRRDEAVAAQLADRGAPAD